jgi:tripartite-type tricarboxylate transporter receptor subunit TctC
MTNLKLLHRRQFVHLAAGAAALPAVSRSACAQVYPTRPITLVVGFAAGGPTDTTARILAERMRVSLGQPVLIENVTGASGTIGVGRVARAAPDGYTLSMGGWTENVVNPAIYSLSYDVLKDFAPISLVRHSPYLIVESSAVPANDLTSLIAWMKASPGKATAGTGGVGGSAHVVGVFFQQVTDTRFRFVPYRGDGPAMNDLVAGQIDIMFAGPITSLPHLRSGRIKAYAVTADVRIASAPVVPTVDEAGLPGFHLSYWGGLWAPRGTPRNVITRLNAAVTDALADPTLRSRFADLAVELPRSEEQTPEALAAFHKSEVEKWWPIIKEAGIRAE